MRFQRKCTRSSKMRLPILGALGRIRSLGLCDRLLSDAHSVARNVVPTAMAMLMLARSAYIGVYSVGTL